MRTIKQGALGGGQSREKRHREDEQAAGPTPPTLGMRYFADQQRVSMSMPVCAVRSEHIVMNRIVEH